MASTMRPFLSQSPRLPQPMLLSRFRLSRSKIPSLQRPFSSTHRRRLDIEPILGVTQTLLQTVHTTSGLSWAASIPLAAFLVRVVLILPFNIMARRAAAKQVLFAPQLKARVSVKAKQLRESLRRDPNHNTTIGRLQNQLKYVTALNAARKGIQKRNGIKPWKMRATMLTQIPIWLVFSETLRRMCGGRAGLLGWLAASPNLETAAQAAAKAEAIQTGDGQSPVAAVDVQSPAAAGDGSIIQLSNNGTEQAGEILSSVAGAAKSAALHNSNHVGVEPGFATEGALWFPNLLLPETQYGLLYAVGAVMFILPLRLRHLQALRAGLPLREGDTSKFSTGLRTALMSVALIFPWLVSSFPSAMLLYWISSSFFGWVQNILLEYFMPLPKIPKPCKTNIQMD